MRIALRVLAAPDCMTYPCQEDCCHAGGDVWPHERDAIIGRGLGSAADFVGPYRDDEGDVLFRTAIGPRGCVFLEARRGCRLHTTGYKPEVCVVAPRSPEEVDELVGEDLLPCRDAWRYEPTAAVASGTHLNQIGRP